MTKEILEKEIKLRSNDPSELGSYLLQLSKEDSNAVRFKEVYERLLQSKDWYLKKVGLFALLFVFKLKDDERIVSVALECLQDIDEKLDVRLAAASGLSVAFAGFKDLKILKTFHQILQKTNEDPSVRYACLEGILYITGLAPTEMLKRKIKARDKFGNVSLTDNLREFKVELDASYAIISNLKMNA